MIFHEGHFVLAEITAGGKYSVNPIQRQTVVGKEDRLECRGTHLGSDIASQMPNLHSPWEVLSNRSKTESLSLLRQGLRLDRVH